MTTNEDYTPKCRLRWKFEGTGVYTCGGAIIRRVADGWECTADDFTVIGMRPTLAQAKALFDDHYTAIVEARKESAR